MNNITNNNKLIPGSLYKLSVYATWPVYNRNIDKPYKEFDISPNDILLFLKIEKNIIPGLGEYLAWIFLNKNLITLVAYSYFNSIKQNWFKKL